MAKIELMQSVHVCDQCQSSQGWVCACLGCGVEHCYDCMLVEGHKYSHGVYVGGSGDGYYCNACDAKLTKSGSDPRHTAYRRVASLRAEAEAWSVEFRKRQEAAEAAVKRAEPTP